MLFSVSLISEIVLGVSFATVCVFLFVGATQRKRSFLVPWLVVAVRTNFPACVDEP